MIKKTILMLLVLVGGVVSANADEAPQTIYLRTNLYINNIDGWSGSNDVYKFDYEGKNPSNPSEDVYTFTVDASSISYDIYFRLWVNGWDYEFAPYASSHNDGYTYAFSNGQNETYTVSVHDNQYKNQAWIGQGEGSWKSKDRTFAISQSSIKASVYKITLYCNGYNSGNNFFIKVDIVSMPVKIGSSGYATFSCDRALNFEGTDIKAYVASNVNSTVVNMTSVTNTPAGTGLFLKGETGETANIPVIVTSEATAVSGNLLYPGTGESVASTNDTYRYVFQNQASGAGFYKLPTDGVVIPKGKSYLEIPASSAPQAPSFSIDLDGETTGIKVINFNEDNNQNNDRMFDLQGRRIAEPTKGVYIVNGKKVIIK